MKKKVLIGIIVAVAVLIAIVAIVIVAPKINCKHDDPSQIVVVKGKIATCQENGLTQGRKCNLCGTMVEPQSIVEKGECLNYELTEDGNYSVSWRSYRCICTEIVIPKTYEGITVTNIGIEAFSGCGSLTSVVIPDSVTTIDSLAFSGCTSLTSIEIPDSVTSIGWSAFSDCTSLTSIEIPDSVTRIGNDAFSGCTSLTSIVIPDSVTSICNYAFRDCISLTSITFEGTIEQWKAIEKSEFWYDAVPATEVVCSDGTVQLN